MRWFIGLAVLARWVDRWWNDGKRYGRVVVGGLWVGLKGLVAG